MLQRLPLLLLLAISSSVFAQPAIQLTQFANGFSNPTDISHAGDSRLFVVEQGGTIRIVDSLGNRLTTPFFSRSVTSGGERGLLGLVFDPGYATNGFFYVHYSSGSNGVISRYSVSSSNPNLADMGSEVGIMTISQPFSNHNGGDLAFGPDGYLYIGMGDGGSGGDPGNRSQNPQERLGKMLRIDVSSLPYTIPPTNPFVGDPTTLDEIWALGLRNPWRWSFDRQTGDLWIADVGQGAREEINFTPAGSTGGENYGWRCYEGNNTYNTSGCNPASAYQFPVHDYPRSIGTSVTGGFVYRGQMSPELDGIYFFGDYGSGRLFGIWPDITNPGSWITHEFMNTSYSLSTFGEDSQGEVYVAHRGGGTIFRIDGPCASFSASLTAINETCSPAQNGSVGATLSGGTTPIVYQWSNGDTTQQITGLDTGKYVVLITDAIGCTFADSVVIGTDSIPIPTPGITPQGPVAFCTGGSVTLTADAAPAGHGYQWIANGMPLNGFTNQDFLVAIPGDYQVTYTGPCATDTSAVVSIDVIQTPPTPFVSGDTGGTYCEDEKVVLYASLPPPGFTYQWYKDGVAAPAQSDSLLIIESGTYTVRFEGPCQSSPSTATTFTIESIPPPPVIAGPDMVDLCDGATVLLNGQDAPAGYGYQWYRDGSPIPGADQKDYQTDQEGAYALTYTGMCPPSPSTPVDITLRDLPQPVIDIIRGDTLIVQSGIAWQWYQDGTPIAGANDSVYIVMASDQYAVEVTDEYGCTGISTEVSVIASSLASLFAAGGVIISPNPARESVDIRFELRQKAAIDLTLTDINGKVIHKETLSLAPGANQKTLNTSNLSAGMYLVRLKGEGQNLTARFVIID